MASKRDGRIFVSRLLRGKTEGVRLEYPLQHETQGISGSPVVNGAGQAGTTLNLRGFQPYYTAKEGYWLSIKDATGQNYLYNVAGDFNASAAGVMTLQCYPPLRSPYLDGALVNFSKPIIEGLVDGDELEWELSLDRNIGLSFSIEEAA
jgi:hypothetical protein